MIARTSTDGWEEGIYSYPKGMLKIMEKAISWDGIVFRQDILKKIGKLKNIHSTDYEFLVRASKKSSFMIYKYPCAMFMEHRGRGLKYINAEKVFYEFFPMALEILKDIQEPEILAEAWKILNHYAIITSSYLFIQKLLQKDMDYAYKIARYIEDLTEGSLRRKKYIVLVNLIKRFPFLKHFLEKYIYRGNFLRSKENTRYIREYSWCIEYAYELGKEAGL